MNSSETAKLIAALKGAYPTFGGENLQMTVKVWTELLSDIPYEQASAAAMAYMCKEHFPPVPADIIHRIGSAQRLEKPTALELWGLIRNAISNGLYGCYEEYQKLPPICQKAVGDYRRLREWAMLGEELETVIASNVQRTLETLIARGSEFDDVPQKYIDAMNPEQIENANIIKMICGSIGGKK